MATINTPEDLLRLLREDAHFCEEARRLILTDELIRLPERFDGFAERTDEHLGRIDGHLQRIDERFERMERDGAYSKNWDSEAQAVERAASIALVLDYDLIRIVPNEELARMTRLPAARDLPRGDLISFSRADLVIEAVDEMANRRFIAVESSHTADERDTRRALRNAEYLTRFTGEPAGAVVASVRNDRNIQSVIDSGQVRWYALEDESDIPKTDERCAEG